jgi:hypothetical protein
MNVEDFIVHICPHCGSKFIFLLVLYEQDEIGVTQSPPHYCPQCGGGNSE